MVVAARLFTAGTLSSLLIMGLVLIPFPTGWEVGTAIVGITSTGFPDGLVAIDCKPYLLSTGEPVPGGTVGECRTGGNTWIFDIDARTWGTPSLLITSQQPRHTDAGNTPTSHDQPADSRTVTRQRDTFYIDRHIFMFEFQVNTVADAVAVHCREILYINNCVFETETSYPPGVSGECVSGPVGCGKGGAPYDGSSLVLFSINPWQGIRQPPDGTIRFDQWVGIMQSTIFKVENGKVPDAPGSQDFPWAVEKLIAEGGQPNMFTVQGDPQSTTQFGTVPLDTRIPQSVLIELPYKLTAGAAVTRGTLGQGLKSVNPINVFAKYIVRVDVAVVTGWTPQLDYIDGNSNGVLDTGEFTFIDKNQDNRWTVGVDEAVSGIPPSPSPATTTTTTADDPVSAEAPAPPPSGLQTGCPPNCPSTIQAPPDIFFPSCNFFDFECRLANWSKFPFDLGTTFSLLLPIIAIVAIVFIGVAVIGVARRRGR